MSSIQASHGEPSLIHRHPDVHHILPTHELSARRARKLPPSVNSGPRRPLEPPRTGRRTVNRPPQGR